MMTRGTRGDVQPFVALARGLAEGLGWMVTVVVVVVVVVVAEGLGWMVT